MVVLHHKNTVGAGEVSVSISDGGGGGPGVVNTLLMEGTLEWNIRDLTTGIVVSASDIYDVTFEVTQEGGSAGDFRCYFCYWALWRTA